MFTGARATIGPAQCDQMRSGGKSKGQGAAEEGRRRRWMRRSGKGGGCEGQRVQQDGEHSGGGERQWKKAGG